MLTVGNGAPRIWNFVENRCVGAAAHELSDFWETSDHLRALSQELHSQDEAALRAKVEQSWCDGAAVKLLPLCPEP